MPKQIQKHPPHNNPESRKDICVAIRQFQRKHGYAPTIRELAAEMEMSIGGIQYHLEMLREVKAVSWVNGKPRTLKVVEDLKLKTLNQQDA